MKFTTTTAAVSALSSAALVAAHGIVDTGIIGAQTFTFYQPYQDPYKSPVPDRISRRIEGNGPVEDVDIADIQCGGVGGAGTEPAKLHANATAGSKVTLNWTDWPASHVGPIITYMARCPDTGCQDYKPGSDAVWFKVQEAGRQGTSNTWAATSMPSNSVAEYTIPACLQSGFYLVRHEIIALHAATSYPGAQFYPGCHQLEVTGSGSTVPSANLVGFPGAYKSTDPGITYNPYTAQEYTIPGPALFSCSGGSTGGSTPTSASSPAASTVSTGTSATSAAPKPTTTAPATGDDEDDEDECVVATPTSTTPAQPVATTPAAGDEAECPADEDEDDEDEDEDDCSADTTTVPTATATAAPKRRGLHERRLAA